jgi:hypothetical protein
VAQDQPLEETPPGEASSEGSSADSSTSSTNPFVGNTGPGFDPDRQPEHQADDVDELGHVAFEIPVIPEEQVRSVLKNTGDLAHAGIGVGQLDWVMTDTDQDRIAPPLTRIINKHEHLARVMGRSDELSVAMGAGLYTWRSLLEREAVLKVKRAEQAAPPPPPRSEPPPVASPAAELGGVALPDDYVPEAFRRFGRQPGGDQ